MVWKCNEGDEEGESERKLLSSFVFVNALFLIYSLMFAICDRVRCKSKKLKNHSSYQVKDMFAVCTIYKSFGTMKIRNE